ncbi:MAG: hypothetical protein HY460_02340 [Parcubacteria group bacterium]|nr:hypothetical protein [Parcubacteria group bacterium]
MSPYEREEFEPLAEARSPSKRWEEDVLGHDLTPEEIVLLKERLRNEGDTMNPDEKEKIMASLGIEDSRDTPDEQENIAEAADENEEPEYMDEDEPEVVDETGSDKPSPMTEEEEDSPEEKYAPQQDVADAEGLREREKRSANQVYGSPTQRRRYEKRTYDRETIRKPPAEGTSDASRDAA